MDLSNPSNSNQPKLRWDELEIDQNEALKIIQEFEFLQQSLLYKLFVYDHEVEIEGFTDLIIESDGSDKIDRTMKGEVRALKRSKKFFERLTEKAFEIVNQNNKNNE